MRRRPPIMLTSGNLDLLRLVHDSADVRTTRLRCNRVVPNSEDARPPMYLGDYPDGAYWSAERHAATGEDEPVDRTVSGSVIRFMWDYGVRIPLWDADGLLPEEPEWLRQALGLSDPLIEDLMGWGSDMESLDATPSRMTPNAYEALDVRARELVQRLHQELGSRFSVRYQPW